MVLLPVVYVDLIEGLYRGRLAAGADEYHHVIKAKIKLNKIVEDKAVCITSRGTRSTLCTHLSACRLLHRSGNTEACIEVVRWWH